MKTYVTILVSLILLFSTQSSFTQTIPKSIPFIVHNTNSARSVGMGGVTILNIDEESVFSNPAAVGLFAHDKTLYFSYPDSTIIARIKNYDIPFIETVREIRLISYNFGIGWPGSIRADNPERKLDYSFGIAYGFTAFNRSYIGQYAGGISFRFSKLTISLGYGLNDITETSTYYNYMGWYRGWSNHYRTHDFGAMLQYALLGNRRLPQGNGTRKKTNTEVILTAAFVSSQNGGRKQSGLQSNKWGASVFADLKKGDFSLFSIRPCLQFERSSDGYITKKGLEICVINSLYVRLGLNQMEPDEERSEAFGFGVTSKGLTHILFKSGSASKNLAYRMARNFEIRLDYSHVPNSDIDYYGVNISI